MKKYILLLLISFLVFPCVVHAGYTMGEYIQTITAGNGGQIINIGDCNNALCNRSTPINNSFTIYNNTESNVFIKFPAIVSFVSRTGINHGGTTGTLFQENNAFVQIYVGNKYYPCEIENGQATCLIPTQKSATYIEFKYNSAYGSIDANFWFELYEIQVFKQPSDVSDIVNNINVSQNLEMQQQQQQHQEIMENNPNSFNNGIESIASNTSLPNNSGLFDVLSSLSSFVGNLSASGSCTAISVPIPFTNQNLRLPCMTTEVYYPNFPEILAIWQLIVRGIVYYYIIVNMLKLLKDTIDPFSMKLEVLDL